MSTRRRLDYQPLVPGTTHGPSERRREASPSPTRPPTPDPSTRPPKGAVEDPPETVHPPANKRAFRRILGSSVPPIPTRFTRSSIANTAPSAAAAPSSSSQSAGKKRVADDGEENIAPSAKKPRSSIVTSQKKRVAAPPPRKVKRLPLREELEVLRAALPPAIRSDLDPPRDDKGPIPNEGKTLGEFLRWKSMYNDELVDRITDEQHVVCKGCGSSFALCHDTAYNWYKWGRHRKCCIRGVDPDEVRVPPAPVLLDQLLPRLTGNPAVDVLFPKEKGGPYYKHSWTYFVPRPGQSRPDDPQEAPAPPSSTLSESRLAVSPPSAKQTSVKSEAGPSRPRVLARASRRLRFQSPRPCPWSLNSRVLEGEIQLQYCSDLSGMEVLLTAAEFMDRTNVLCSCDIPPSLKIKRLRSNF